MINKTMKTLTIGENTYEIVDEYARNEIKNLEDVRKQTEEAIRYTAQNLTDEQKAQARENIGALSNGYEYEELELAYVPYAGVNKHTYAYTELDSPEPYASMVAKAGKIKGGILKVDYDLSRLTSSDNKGLLDIGLYLFDENGNPYKHTGYGDGQGYAAVGNGKQFGFIGELYEPIYVDPAPADNLNIVNAGYSYGWLREPFTTQIPSGCTVQVYIRYSKGWPCAEFANANELCDWIMNGGIVFSVSKESPVVYDDFGIDNANKFLVTNENGKVVPGGSVDGVDVPNYWREYLDGRLGSIREKIISNGTNCDSFMFFTDHHTGASTWSCNANYSKNIIDYVRVRTSIDRVFFGGDILNTVSNQTKEQALSWLWKFHDDYISKRSVLPILGNHETMQYNTNGSCLTIDEVYPVLFKNVELITDTNRKPYYYVDNTSQKVRYIVLDNDYEPVASNAEQSEWYIDALLSMETGWTAILLVHSYYTSGNMNAPIADDRSYVITQIADDYNKRNNGSNSVASWDFSGGVGEVACLVCGHTHYDYSEVSNGILTIVTTTDCGADPSNAAGENNAGITREGGAITEQAMDLFFINTEDRTIETIRLGSGEDRSWTYGKNEQTLSAVYSTSYAEGTNFTYTESATPTSYLHFSDNTLVGNKLTISWDDAQLTQFEFIPYLFKDGVAYKYAQSSSFGAYGVAYSGHLDLSNSWIDPNTGSGYLRATGGCVEFDIPEGCTVMIGMRFIVEVAGQKLPSDSTLQLTDISADNYVTTWAKNGGITVTVTE